MFIKWDHEAVRLTGRWSRLREDSTDIHIFNKPTAAYASATATGSYFEMAFIGRMALLHFDLGYLVQPMPHLWIQVDGGARVEVPVDRHLRVDALTDGEHIVKVTFKSGMDEQNRWHLPLMSKISFVGADIDAPGTLPADNRRIIEFLGDSITEGIFADMGYNRERENIIDQFNRVYQNDELATYASLTAEALDLRPIFQAYGAVGVTRTGSGGVPRAGLIYPYVYDGVPYTGEKPDIIVCNHGTNDLRAESAEFLPRYAEYMDIIREHSPNAVIVCLTPFGGWHHDDIRSFVEGYNMSHEKKLHFISTKGWIPAEPSHPLREGHREAARRLIPLLKDIIEKELG